MRAPEPVITLFNPDFTEPDTRFVTFFLPPETLVLKSEKPKFFKSRKPVDSKKI